MKYRFDINNVDIVNLNGVDLKNAFKTENSISFEKSVGNMIFENTWDIDLSDKAREIHKGNPVEFSEREKGLFEEVLKGRYIPFIEKQILAEIREV